MAYNPTNAPSSGIWNAVKGALGLFEDINKTEGFDENKNSQPQDEFESKMSDVQIIELTSNWKRTYNTYYQDIEGSQKTAFSYWIGKQDTEEAETVNGGGRPLIDNLIFEAIETFIPIATRANPDPLVTADPSEQGQKLANDIKEALVHEADRMKFRKVLKRLLRHWLIYKIGVLKHSYNLKLQKIEVEAINPKLMLFDKDGYIDEGGNFRGEYLGQKMSLTASELIEIFPKKEQIIMEKAKGKKGTKIDFISWWYRGTDNFYTVEDTVLGKFLNPHWNYDSQEGETPVEGKNHLPEPMYPYTFLAIFSTGLQPHDETSLITQNIGLQDMVNRRYRQIDDNIRKMNNGLVVSNQFTDSQASQAAAALARGVAIRAAGDDVTKSVMRLPASPLPADVFNMLNDGRQQIKNIFGTSGSSPSGINKEQTVRGKILVNQLDTSRIGGGITEYLEQIADTTYNWWVQMMFVHWTDPQYIVASGITGGQEIINIKNTDFLMLKSLSITVKEGSLIPKDPLTQRNEAIDLWSAGAIDPKTFYRRLDFADPDRTTEQLLTWQLVQKGALPPQAYLPNFGRDNPALQQAQMLQQQSGALPTDNPGEGGVGGPAVNDLGGEKPDLQQPSGSGTQLPESQVSSQLIKSVPVQ